MLLTSSLIEPIKPTVMITMFKLKSNKLPLLVLLTAPLILMSYCIQAAAPSVQVNVQSYKDILALYDEVGLTDERWQEGSYQLPRLQLKTLSPSWRDKTVPNVSVNLKKKLFFTTIGSIALQENEKIKSLRKEVTRLSKKNHLSRQEIQWLKQLANDYKIDNPVVSKNFFPELLKHINIIPTSMLLAQAAEESGWGTSRFAIEGNALFGQWTYTGDGMTPKEQRTEKGNYQIRKFPSLAASIAAYMKNLNTHPAYDDMRTHRAKLVKANKPLTGLELATYLFHYSERGEEYVSSIKSIITYNGLEAIDQAVLLPAPIYKLNIRSK